MSRKQWFTFLTILVILITVQVIEAVSMKLILNVDQEHGLGENVLIHGSLMLDGSPVTDGLVAIQIDDPNENLFVLRTLPTGDSPVGPWVVEIPELVTCDKFGNAKSSFALGEGLGINITVRNNGLTSENVMVTLNLYDSTGLSFLAQKLFQTELGPEQEERRFIWPIPISEYISLGPAFVYSSALHGWPKEDGYAYCPEVSVGFNIVGGGGGETYTSEESFGTSTPGEFNLTFRTNPEGGITGNYSISAVSQYQMLFITNSTTFEVILFGDVNGDGKVRVDDVLAVALAFGMNEGDEGWDPRVDLNGDGKVRVDDVLIVAQAFGNYSG